MKIYVDLIFIINILFDFILLLSVSIILKRNAKFIRIFLGSLIGGTSIFFLFFKLNSMELFMLKFIISIFMILSTFGYKNIKYFINNFIYLYISSITIGGAMYLIKEQISLNNDGLIFIGNDYFISLIFIIILFPIILFIYVKRIKQLKNNYNNYYKVVVFYNEKTYEFTGYLDTGNKLKDPYKKRPILLIDDNKMNISYENSILVPYKTIKGDGLIKCVKVDKVIIDDKYILKNQLIGLSKEKILIDGVNMLLNSDSLGGYV